MKNCRRACANQAAECWIIIHEQVLPFDRRSIQFVTDSVVDGEVGRGSPLVVHVDVERASGKMARKGSTEFRAGLCEDSRERRQGIRANAGNRGKIGKSSSSRKRTVEQCNQTAAQALVVDI